MNEDRAARYHRLRRRSASLGAAARGCVLLGVCGIGLRLADDGASLIAPIATTLPAALAGFLLCLATELASLPFAWHTEFTLEQRFGLSRESVAEWWRDHVRAVGLELMSWTAAAAVISALLARWPGWWWLAATTGFLGVGVLRASLFPFVFRAQPLRRQELRTRLAALARRAGAPVMGIDQWRISSRSDVANAAVVGLGPTRRIIVSDTLIEDYSDDEVEVVIAHEIGHHVHRDVWQTLTYETVVVGVALLVADALVLAPRFGQTAGRLDVVGLSTVALVVGAVRVALSPAGKWLSRWHERRADAYALALTGNQGAFVSGLRRLGAQHLAEGRPPWPIEWLFYSHPPVAERIAHAQTGQLASTE